MLSPDFASEVRGNIFDYQTYASPAHYGAQYVDVEVIDSGASQISIIGHNGDAVSLTTSLNSQYVML